MSFWSKLRDTFLPERRAAEIDEELEYHLAMSAEDHGDRREARLRLGNPLKTREEIRAAGVFEGLESLWQDVRYGFRQMSRTSLLTAAILTSLAVGIGANTAMFTIADAVLLKSLPVGDPDSLRVVQWSVEHGYPEQLSHGHSGTTDGDPRGRFQGSSFGPQLYRTLADEQNAVDALIGYSDVSDAAVSAGGRIAGQVAVQYVSENFFRDLDVPLHLGNGFTEQDDQIGQEPVAVLSHRYWQQEFGGSANALGETIRINNTAARVIGVAPPGFYGIQVGRWTDIYTPLAARVAFSVQVDSSAVRGEDDRNWWVRLIARLRPNVDAAAAGHQLTVLFQRFAPRAGADIDPAKLPTLIVEPGRRGFDPMDGGSERPLWILLLLVGLVLLIVCANVANLLLSRAVARQREGAVRLALGASRLRLLRQQLVESFLLAAMGGALGLGVSYLLTETGQMLLKSVLGEIDAPIDLRVLGFTAGIALLTALLFGLAPALRAARADWNEGLKSQGRSILAGRLRLPRALVVAQLALCVTVVAAAGLLTRSLSNLRAIDIGFNRENVVYASVNPWQAGYKPAQARSYVERLREKLSAQPGITSVATTTVRPLSGSFSSTTANIVGRPYVEDGSAEMLRNSVGPGMFETLGLPLLAGRTFDARDMAPGADGVVVNELFAKRFFPNQNPLGQRFGTSREDNDSLQIIGVVGNSLYGNLRMEVRPTSYQPLIPGGSDGDPRARSTVHYVMRAAVDSDQVAELVRRAAASVDPNVPVNEIETQTSLIDRLLRAERTLSALSTAFGAVALGLAAVGLAGLLGYAVARRRNEIGIRMALGAAPRQVVRMVLGDSMRLTVLGTLLGLPGAYAIGRLLERVLYGLQPADPLTAFAAVAVLLAVAALAACAPARRAARIDPLAALRDE